MIIDGQNPKTEGSFDLQTISTNPQSGCGARGSRTLVHTRSLNNFKRNTVAKHSGFEPETFTYKCDARPVDAGVSDTKKLRNVLVFVLPHGFEPQTL